MSIALSPRRRLASGGLIVAVLAVLAVGSFVVREGRGDHGTQNTVSPPGTVAAIDANTPPELKNTGEDWDQIVRSIYSFEHWLYLHPHRADLLTQTELPSYSGFSDGQLGLNNLATKGWRYDPPRQQASVELVRLQDRPRPDLAVVFVRSTIPPNRVVDSSGKVVLDDPGVKGATVLWTLQREPPSDPHWRLAKVTPMTAEPPRP